MENNYPNELLYNEDYSWLKVEDDVVTIGVIAESAKQVEEFVFVMLPEVGKKLKKGDVYVNLEAVKWSGQLTTPVSGEIIEINQPLFNEPNKINKEAYQSWIAKIKLDDKTQLKELMNAEKAKKYYQEKLK